MEAAIAAYQAALRVCTQQAFPEKWAEIQDNLGNAYDKLFHSNRIQNLELAIMAHQAALQVFTRDGFPQKWATTQNGSPVLVVITQADI